MIEMTLDMATRAAQAALAKGAEMGIALGVTVVDEAGRVVVVMRADRAGFLTTETSRAKAVAAASFKRATLELAELHQTNPFWTAVPTVSRGDALPTGGAVPIVVSDRVIGAIGCGGGTPQQDHECSLVGVAAASAQS